MTRPKPKLVSKHLSAPVQPINAAQTRAHYVGKRSFMLWQWMPTILFSVLVLTISWLVMAVVQKANYAGVGEMVCKQGALSEPQILCPDGDLDCLTNPTVVEVSKIKDAIRERNTSIAKACISVM